MWSFFTKTWPENGICGEKFSATQEIVIFKEGVTVNCIAQVYWKNVGVYEVERHGPDRAVSFFRNE